ncbi:MAG: flagellar motor protein MotB [Bacteroidetes bacterium B1(2017)]|nr:MAG: flagellar motor protein MotB [Bacteroidetes bacterium B1(2017)]
MHNAFLSKRMTEATYQRDSMHLLNLAFNKDTTQRGIQYRELEGNYRALNAKYADLTEKHKALQSDYNEMNDKYTDLIRSSLNKTEQLNLALKEKGEQLLAREKRLAELEALIRKQDSITNALNNIIKKALLSFNSDEITVEMKNGKVYVSMTDKLLFRSGSADVEEKGKEAIKKLADVLNKNTDVGIMIEGHTDNVPIKTAQFADNWDLSVARSTNIVRLLDEIYKVDAKRLTAAGRGEYLPKASNETSEGRAKNRRTEIILTPKLDELYKLIEKR